MHDHTLGPVKWVVVVLITAKLLAAAVVLTLGADAFLVDFLPGVDIGD